MNINVVKQGDSTVLKIHRDELEDQENLYYLPTVVNALANQYCKEVYVPVENIATIVNQSPLEILAFSIDAHKETVLSMHPASNTVVNTPIATDVTEHINVREYCKLMEIEHLDFCDFLYSTGVELSQGTHIEKDQCDHLFHKFISLPPPIRGWDYFYASIYDYIDTQTTQKCEYELEDASVECIADDDAIFLQVIETYGVYNSSGYIKDRVKAENDAIDDITQLIIECVSKGELTPKLAGLEFTSEILNIEQPFSEFAADMKLEKADLLKQVLTRIDKIVRPS